MKTRHSAQVDMRRFAALFALLAAPGWACADAPDHIPPAAPANAMPAMSDASMAQVMEMNDDAHLGMIKFDQLESASGDGSQALSWDADAWYGGDFNKLWLRSEGERSGGRIRDARVEAFWNHAYASYWDWQLGARHDFGAGPQRDWAAFGVRGVAPYWIEIEATAYIGEGGRLAGRLRAEYELLITQRLILQPEAELNFYDRSDAARGIVAGLSDARLGLRLRYEIRHELAPYVGVTWQHQRDGAFLMTDSDRSDFMQWVAGVRFWF